jgi:hypothetical protein
MLSCRAFSSFDSIRDGIEVGVPPFGTGEGGRSGAIVRFLVSSVAVLYTTKSSLTREVVKGRVEMQSKNAMEDEVSIYQRMSGRLCRSQPLSFDIPAS